MNLLRCSCINKLKASIHKLTLALGGELALANGLVLVRQPLIFHYDREKTIRKLIKNKIKGLCGLILCCLFVVSVAGSRNVLSKELPGSLETNQVTYSLPLPLSTDDSSRYTRIFELQKNGHWRKSQKIIQQLSNKILLGHVLAQKFLHPTKYRSKYPELLLWMKSYADHPQAKRIYSLASRRRPSNWKSPPKPTGKFLRGNGPVPINQKQFTYMSTVKRSKLKKRQAIKLQRHMTGLIRKGWPTGAYKSLLSPRVQKGLHPYEIESSRSEIAHGYFIFGKDQLAIKLAKQSISKFPKKIALGAWAAGLAAWRSNQINDAEKFFENVANNMESNNGLAAAGAFWASRSHLLNERPKQAIRLLQKAASFEGTFYGMIAARALGLEPSIKFDSIGVSEDLFSNIGAYPQLQRMLALLQIKKYKDAEKEMRSLYHAVPNHLKPSLMMIAADYGMPGFAMRSAGILKQGRHAGYLKALYPLPPWKPPIEAKVDPAFIYAMVRQESQFYARAKSKRGARGLMQLMPRTAASIGKSNRFRRGRGRDALFDPKINLILGSKYLLHLMQTETISRNLFKLLAAYNAGPGNLRKWEQKVKYKKDPLLFIESIPSRETRHFIKKVMLGLWVYRYRLNEPALSLNDIASGNWPQYVSASKNKR